MVTPASENEWELLQLLHKNDEQAFETLYHRYWKSLFHLANYLLRDPAIAEDVVQEVYISFWRRRESLQVKSLSAYLSQATRFGALKAIRERRLSSQFYQRLAEITSYLVDDIPLHFKEQEYIVNGLLNTLPEEFKEAFRLSRFENLTYKEIAARLGVTEKVVEYRISQALKHIKNGLLLWLMFENLLRVCLN